jgi:uncharacterized protein DUF4440
MIAFLLAAAAAASTPAPMPAGPALRASIQARDGELFELFFRGCDPARLRTMLADDVEFYHDKGGFVFRNAEAMVADYAKQCAERAKPDAWRSRRELVVSSLIVDPVPGYGAMEAGDHLFYERKGDGPERLAGRASFSMVWKWDEGRWQLSRVLSFAHRAEFTPRP